MYRNVRKITQFKITCYILDIKFEFLVWRLNNFNFLILDPNARYLDFIFILCRAVFLMYVRSLNSQVDSNESYYTKGCRFKSWEESLKKGGKLYLFCVEIGSSRPIVRFPLEESPNPNIIKQLGPPPRGQIQDHWCSHLDLSQTSTPSCSPLKPSPLIEGDLYL